MSYPELSRSEARKMDDLIRRSRARQAHEAKYRRTPTQEEVMAKRKKQQALPGMERKTIKEIDDAAEHYVDQRDARMKLTEKESDAKQALIAAMKKHGVETYKDEATSPALVVTLVPGTDKVKVTEADEEKEEAA
jgi:hypothetical protein